VPRPSLPLEDAFANAPERDRDLFRVPPTGAAEESSA
jgi:Asp-tRNA(Asn)/Glu-tRNA(Gln) amidotransferase C subunit